MLFCLVSLGISAQEVGIKFINDSTLSDALTKAKQENKLLFVDCYTSWCGPCKYMVKNIFPQREVGDFYNKNFVCWKADTEKLHSKADSIAFANFQIQCWPTFLLLNWKGEIIHRQCGSGDVAGFIELGKTALDPSKNFYSIQEKVNKGDRTAETLYTYYAYSFDNTEKYISEHFALVSDSLKFSEPTWRLFDLVVKNVDGDVFKYFSNHLSQYEQKLGKKAVETKLYRLFDYYNRSGNPSITKLKQVDTVLYAKYERYTAYQTTYYKYNRNRADKKSWNDLIKATDKGFATKSLTLDQLNDVSWLVYECYNKMNDREALKKACVWSKKTVDAMPNNHPFNDTYAHILFALGNKKEAIRLEEFALKIATELNATEQIKFYSDELKIYNKK